MSMFGHGVAKHGLAKAVSTRHVPAFGIPTMQARCPAPATLLAAVVALLLATNPSSGQAVPPAGKDPSAKTRSAESAPETSSDLKAKIQQAIVDLGSTEFAVRERASRELWNAGAKAEPALKKVVRETDDFEVVYRARQLLESFEMGIYPDTPAEIVLLIGQFRMGNLNVKQGIGQRLRAQDKTELLRRLIARETNPFVREQLKSQLLVAFGTPGSPAYAPGSARRVPHVANAAEMAQAARLRLAERDFDGALRLLRGGSDESVRDCAALLLSQNKLDAAIAQLRGGLQAGDAPGQRRLAWMLRAKGDLAGAVAAARLTNDNGLVEGLLAEMGDWKALAKIDAKTDVDALVARPDGTQKLAKILLFRRLAGEKQAFDLAATAAVKALKQRQFRDRNLLGALVLNDRAEQVIAASAPQDEAVVFEILVAQNRMKEALRLVKIDVPVPAKIDWAAWLREGKGEVSQERFWLACQVLRTLHAVGEGQQARELTAAMLVLVGEKLQEDDDWEAYAMKLLDSEVAAGRPESSDALAVKLLAMDFDNPEVVISHLYHNQDTIAVLLWRALRKQFPREDRLAALKHLRRLLTGKPDATAVEELPRLVSHMEPGLQAQNFGEAPDGETSEPRARKLLAVAALFHNYGQSTMTRKYLALVGTGVSAQSLIDEGNLYADEKQWNEAAKAYEAAWNKNRSAATLYLQGWAQTKCGAEAEGRKRMELALMFPLADGRSRRELMQALVRLHQDDEAARQRQWLLRVVPIHDWSIVLTLMETGGAAAEKGTAADMATVWQRAAVELLLTNTVFTIEARDYLQWCAAAHCARARELLRADKTAEAVEELRQAETARPDNIELALECDPELRKHGAAGEADALYRRMLQRHEAYCRDFARGGVFHNNLAWLAARLDRDLDKALAHAQRAVELEPQSAGDLDTLAEVHFRRGNRAEALRLAKRCLEMEPDGEHYQKQLARFEGKPEPAKK